MESPFRLRPFAPAAPLQVEVAWSLAAGPKPRRSPILDIHYTVGDPNGEILWPTPSEEASARDGLWRHTCMELFIGLDRAESYCELNVSPGGDWAFYYFEGYRQRGEIAGSAPAPTAALVADGPGRRTLSFQLDLGRIHDLIGHPKWRWQPTAVLESSSGLSYWAPSHPGDRPDFHRLDHLPTWDPYAAT